MSRSTNMHLAGFITWFLVAMSAFLPVNGKLCAELNDPNCAECHLGKADSRQGPKVDFDQVKGSAHQGLSCVECHNDITGLPHEFPLKKVDKESLRTARTALDLFTRDGSKGAHNNLLAEEYLSEILNNLKKHLHAS